MSAPSSQISRRVTYLLLQCCIRRTSWQAYHAARDERRNLCADLTLTDILHMNWVDALGTLHLNAVIRESRVIDCVSKNSFVCGPKDSAVESYRMFIHHY